MAPRKLGKYTVLEKIGEGASGEVFRAHDPQLDRFVAIKTLRPKGNDDSLERFQREGLSVAQLKHPNIVTIFELGMEDSKLFMALELLEGIDLKQVIDSRAPLSLDQKLGLLEQICDATGFMHSKGLIHRDLKPANIRILPDGTAKIMDFGLVRLASSDLTMAGMILGTPYYMSPEQIQGKPTGTPSDVFSLGAISYELLSYRKPFRSPSLFTVQVEISQGEHEPLSNLVPRLPDSLIRIVDTALAKSPNDRYQDAGEMLQALRTVRGDSEFESMSAAKGSLVPITSFDEKTVLEKTFTAIDDEEARQREQAPANPVGPMGGLTTKDIAQLIGWCSTNRGTGTIRAHSGPVEKAFFIESGRLVACSSNSPRETLGQLLIAFGHVTEEQLLDALLQQEQAYTRLDHIILARGLASRFELQRLHEFQTKERIYDCFVWSDGCFDFEDGQIPAGIDRTVSLELSAIIREGLARARKMEAIQRVIPSRLTRFRFAEAVTRRAIDISDENRHILNLVEQGLSLAEIAIQTHFTEFHAASLLLELHDRDLIEVESVSVDLSQEQQVKDLGSRLSEGLDCFKEGKTLEALLAFEAALQIDPQSKAYEFVARAARIMEDSHSLNEVPLAGIPVLKAPFDALTQIELDPSEGFVLSRLNGKWDVHSIMKICPLSERQVLLALKRFLDNGLIDILRSSGKAPVSA